MGAEMDERCILNLKFTPCEECLLGKNLFKQFQKPYCRCKSPKFKDKELLNCKYCGKIIVRCPWGINSSKYNYCFFNWFEKNNSSCSPTEIGKLLNITVQRVGQILKKSLFFLRNVKIFNKE